jgi:hypothetical protein
VKTAEEIKQASEALKGDIKLLIDTFVSQYGECNIMISTSAKFIEIGQDKFVYAGHDIDISVVI